MPQRVSACSERNLVLNPNEMIDLSAMSNFNGLARRERLRLWRDLRLRANSQQTENQKQQGKSSG